MVKMLKYRGTYRVLFEIDKAGKPCEFTFIPCRIKKGANICRHNGDVLNIYIPSIKMANRLSREYPDLFKPFQTGDSEAVLLFNEADIEKAAAILKARVMGKGMSPKPKRKVTISEERKQELSERMKELHSINKNIRQIVRKTG